jgi:hypothetical protein
LKRGTTMEEQKVTERFAELRALRKWNEEQGRFVVEAWEASGEPMKTFAHRVGIWPQRVQWWKERLLRTDAAGSAPAATPTSTFVPVIVRGLGDDAEALLEPMGAVLTAAAPVTVTTAATAVTGAAPLTVVVSPGIRIEVTDLDVTSVAWVAALVRSLREVSP